VVMDKQEHGDHAKCFDVITADISLELNTWNMDGSLVKTEPG
jgi:hypothetical protein